MIKTAKRVSRIFVIWTFDIRICFNIPDSDFDFLSVAENDFFAFACAVHLKVFSSLAD